MQNGGRGRLTTAAGWAQRRDASLEGQHDHTPGPDRHSLKRGLAGTQTGGRGHLSAAAVLTLEASGTLESSVPSHSSYHHRPGP